MGKARDEIPGLDKITAELNRVERKPGSGFSKITGLMRAAGVEERCAWRRGWVERGDVEINEG